MYLIKTPLLLKKLYPKQLIWNKSRADKVIYLTFDDGPIPIVTPWVLKTLKNFNAKATFFCIGDNIYKNPEIFVQLNADGHAIGNHTFNHLKGWNTEDNIYLDNYKKCQELTQTNLFRPPYGRIKRSQIKLLLNSWKSEVGSRKSEVSSQKSITSLSKNSTIGLNNDLQDFRSDSYQNENFKSPVSIIMWDVLSGDFDIKLSPKKCLNNVIKHTENGSIVVFHDSLKAWERLEYVLPKALEIWRKEGFQFKTLDF